MSLAAYYRCGLDHKAVAESQTAGLQFLWPASRLKPWLRTIDGLWWLAMAYEYKQENELQQISSQINLSHYYVKSNTEKSNDAVRC